MSRRILPEGFVWALRMSCCVAAFAALSACQSFGGRTASPPGSPAATTGEVIGSGAVRVAMLLPRSGGGNAASTAVAFRNAAELVTRDFPTADLSIAVYDTRGTPAGAQAAASAALGEGAELILGPVFSAEVSAVAQQARQAGVPVVAFSSDVGVAGPGVYLLSFLPSDDVERIVGYAAGQGRKSFAALLPANAYGSVVEASFRRAVAASGGRIVAIETYAADAADIRAKAAAIVRIARQADALLIPDVGEASTIVASALNEAGITRDKLKLLGSGQWDDPRILNDLALVGSWYPAPSKQGYDELSRKYQAAYGSVPPRNATLAYDATVLAAGLVRKFGVERFQTSVLTNANGFAGLDGTFRFGAEGFTERRLAVYEVTGNGSRIVAPAARSFAAGS